MLDMVRGNRASSATIAVTVGVSSLLLAMLTCVLYNFLADSAAQAQAEGVNWIAQLGDELLVSAALYSVVLLLACVALVLIIRNAFAASMQARLHQLGLLVTAGATPHQVRSMLVCEALLLSLVPAALGIGLGTLAARMFVAAASDLARQIGVAENVPLTFQYHPLLLAATVVLVLITVLVSAGLPARKLSHIGPLAAIAGGLEAPQQPTRRRWSLACAFGIEGELAADSMRQRRGALRSASLALGLAFLVLGLFLSFMTVSHLSVQQTYYERYGIAWDAVVDVPDASAADLDALAHRIDELAASTMVEPSDKGMRLYLQARDGATDSLYEAVVGALRRAGYADFTFVDMAADEQRSQAIWDGYTMVAGGFCAILALIGIAGIFAQALGFLYQRRREFARLRSLGMTPSGIFKMLMVEGLCTIVRPVVMALPFLVGAAVLLAYLARQSPQAVLAAFPYGILLGYLVVVGALVSGAYALGAFRLVRSDLSQMLRDDTLM